MKKEVSDHIAHVFFEKKGLKKKKPSSFLKAVTLIAIGTLALASLIVLSASIKKIVVAGPRIIFAKHDGPYVLNFNFENTASKIESLVIDLPDINLNGYKKIKFSIRLVTPLGRREGIVKVTLVNHRKEMSSLYVSQVSPSWKQVELKFSDFKSNNDWSRVNQLVFDLEEWNVSINKGKLMIDAIGFSK